MARHAMPMALALAAIVAASVAAAGAHAQADGNAVGPAQAASSLWDDSHAGGQYADLGYVEPQPIGGYGHAAAGGLTAHQAPPAGGGNSVGSEQAASSLWDDSHVGGQYADLGYIAPQPPGKHDDETAAGQQWDTGYGDEYADPRDASSGKPDGGSPGGGTAVRSGQADKS
ncbi:MAG: hypothetical protein OXU37_04140, partial [Thaumarchaeota archaeon]|nr:hypothetical protein [Nitrososphaerota archaeon]